MTLGESGLRSLFDQNIKICNYQRYIETRFQIITFFRCIHSQDNKKVYKFWLKSKTASWSWGMDDNQQDELMGWIDKIVNIMMDFVTDSYTLKLLTSRHLSKNKHTCFKIFSIKKVEITATSLTTKFMWK